MRWLLLSHYYDTDGTPLRCYKCGGTEFYGNNDSIYEEEFYCKNCNECVGQWAYGYYNPDFERVVWQYLIGGTENGNETECRS